MQRHSIVHRTASVPRARHNTGRPVSTLYGAGVRAEATWEQVHNDDGRADGVPVRRWWMFERHRRRTVEQITRMVG